MADTEEEPEEEQEEAEEAAANSTDTEPIEVSDEPSPLTQTRPYL